MLFQRGAFDAADTNATAAALAVYGLGLPAFVLQKVVQPVFFAREDTRSPFRYAVVAMVVNAAVAVGLAPVIGFMAAPVATTLSAWVMLVLLIRGAHARFPRAVAPDARLTRALPRMLAASLAMGLLVWGLGWALQGALAAPGLRYPALAALVGAGALAYAALTVATGALRPADLRAALRRGGS